MVFSSTIFLFIFLPLSLAGYYLLRRKCGSLVLLAASLAFYAWGAPSFILIMIGSVIVNYGFALLGSWQLKAGKTARPVIVATVIFNVVMLVIYKYLNFFLINLNVIFKSALPQTSIALPIGISFFTFTAISYVFDVCRGKVEAQRNPLTILLYICFFPKMIQGPIVRYETIADSLTTRRETLEDFAQGIERFIIGLAKKVILANTIGVAVDYCFGQVGNTTLTVGLAWLGAIGYTLQIYYDFSGYSDMAIGLCLMFGFHIGENFNYPYNSSSVSEFWRRWHISLGSWFRDYVYFPLGGSRVKSKARLILNLFVVWLLTGVWHGANWTFIIWGLLYFVLLTFEKLTGWPDNFKNILSRILYRIFTLLFIIIGWVIFRAPSLTEAWVYILSMFGAAGNELYNASTAARISQYGIFIIIGIIFSFPVIKQIDKGKSRNSLTVDVISKTILILLAVVSVMFTLAGTYNAFIYFKF